MGDGGKRLAPIDQFNQPAQVFADRAGDALWQAGRHQLKVEMLGQHACRGTAEGFDQALEAARLAVDVDDAVAGCLGRRAGSGRRCSDCGGLVLYVIQKLGSGSN